MGAMEINNSGTTARDGLSGGVDRTDAANVGVRIDAGRRSDNGGAQDGQDAWQGRHSCVQLPSSNAVHRQGQHNSKMRVAGQTELGEKIPLRDRGQPGERSEDFRAEVMARNARDRFDGDGHGWRHAPPRAPIADSALANTKMGGKGCDPAGGFHGSVECVHSGRITYRDPSRNTIRVSALSHTVKNPGMAFSDNLRAARLKAGMTQEALALACGWSGQSRIANYESSAASAREPKVSEVPLLAAALGVSIASLFGEAPASQSPRPDPAILAETHQFLDKAFGTLGKAFDIESEADLFADVYEWILADERPADQRNLVDFAAWREKRDLHRGAVRNEQNGRATAQAGRTDKRRA